ncbi:hypothetical protein D3C78_1767610 [compost metagenome]
MDVVNNNPTAVKAPLLNGKPPLPEVKDLTISDRNKIFQRTIAMTTTGIFIGKPPDLC